MAITLPTTVNDNSIVNNSGQDIIADALGGNDTIVTAGGKDTIEGGAGNDFVSTGANHNSITNSSGNDSLIAGSGNDSITDLDGSDYIDAGSGDDYIRDTANPFEGGEGDFNRIIAGSGHDRVTVIGAAFNNIDLGSGNDVLTIEGGEGIIIESSLLFALIPQEFLFNNVIDAGSGNDTVTTDDGSDSINANSGNDTVTTGGGFDVVIGLDGNDTVFNNDNSFLIGGPGNEILIASGDRFEGGSGFDTLSYAADTLGVNVDLDDGAGGQSASGGDAEDDFISGFEHVIGGAGNDVLTGNALGNTLIGNAGNDTLSGEGGHDFLQGGAGIDLLLGGAGNDTINVTDTDSADDTVTGGAGNDTINMSIGNDSDLVDINPGDGVDTINGFDNFGAPRDRLDISDLISFVGGSTDLAGAVAGGFVNFANSGAGNFNLLQVDANGGGDAFSNTAIINAVVSAPFADEAAAVAALNGTIIVA